MCLELRSLEDASLSDLEALLNDRRVRRHLADHAPLSTDSCFEFVRAKRRHWDRHGFGVWAIFQQDRLIGWGGPQRWGAEEVELALVLHPVAWGVGPEIARLLIEKTFRTLQIDSLLVLLRDSRPRSRALLKAGFVYDGADTFQGESFSRYRLGRTAFEEPSSSP